MIKIACLVRVNPAQIYFLNRINERCKISLAIVEAPEIPLDLTNKVREKGILGSIEDITNRILYPRGKQKRRISDCKRYLGDKWKSIDREIPLFTVKDINSEAVYERLNREKPDLILDHGTSLVKDNILETAPLALNLHWGLSPYYRGSYCTEWALINWDPYNIGATIHKLSRKIDGGDIIAQKRAVLAPGDTTHSINMQLTKLGVDLIIDIISRIEAGGELKFKKQDCSLGILTRNKQWGRHLFKQVENIENRDLIKAMLERPARLERFPIVEL